MNVRCKFQVSKVSEFAVPPGCNRQQEICLTAVHGSENAEDVSFSQYTPNGNITFSVTNPAVLDQFKPGSYYYVDFTPAK